jgi:hypothetical protein
MSMAWVGAIRYPYLNKQCLQNSTHTRTHGYETLPRPITDGYPYPFGAQSIISTQ